MAVKQIRRLRGCGIFQDFTWPSDLPDMERFNLVYGWNGTGKTTISRILRNLEHREVPLGDNVTLAIDGQDVTGSDFPNQPAQIRVFNRDFVRESVFPIGGGDVRAIYVLGTQSVEKQKQIEELKSELEEAVSVLQKEESAKRDADAALDRHCIDRGSIIRTSLRTPGQNRFSNYNKARYQNRARGMVDDGDSESHHLDETLRVQLQSQHTATPKPRISEVICHLPELGSLADEVANLLSTTVVSELIQSLRDDPELAQWVRDGLRLHHSRDRNDCLFCEQTMPPERLSALEDHFNDHHERLMVRLDKKVTEIRKVSARLSGLSMPASAELYDDLAAEYTVAIEGLRQSIDTVGRFMDSLEESLLRKKSRMFEKVSICPEIPESDTDITECLNLQVRRHNEASDNHMSRGEEAREKLEADLVAIGLDAFRELKTNADCRASSVVDAVARAKCLRAAIACLELEIVEHRRPAEELNDDLFQYLGHRELQLKVEETGYTITRNGVSATSLSEGETTALALLYFLKSLEDHQFDLASGTVVLDDPVSSMDANALYLAFGMIKARTREAGQVLILTHNFTFFRQVRNWFRHLDSSDRPPGLYMVVCTQNGHLRNSTIQPLDKLLKQYESEYQYLFACIYRAVSCSVTSLEENYALPNMGRRLLEAFLAFRKPDISGSLWRKLEDIEFDEVKKTKIRRFVDSYSHADAIEEPEHDLSLLSEARSVLKDILDLMQSMDDSHYRAMVRAVSA